MFGPKSKLVGPSRSLGYGTTGSASAQSNVGSTSTSALNVHPVLWTEHETHTDDEHVESMLLDPKNAKSKIICTRKGRIWGGVVGGLVALISILLILFYVAAPKFVQSRIRATSLEFSSMVISNARYVDSQWIVSMNSTAMLSGLSPVEGTIHAFDATLTYSGAEVLKFRFPTVRAFEDYDNIIHLSLDAVVNPDSFNSFGNKLLAATSLEVTISGIATVSTNVFGSQVSIRNVHFSKSIDIPGCQGFPHASIASLSLTNSTPTEAIATAVVVLENPSIVSILNLGDIALQIKYEDVLMGQFPAPSLSLYAGTNTLTLTGQMSSTNMTAMQSLIGNYLGGVSSLVSSSGVATNGTIPLFSSLVSGLSLSTWLPPSPDSLIQGLHVDGMTMIPIDDKSLNITLKSTISALNMLGSNSPLNIVRMSLQATLEGLDGVLGEMSVPLTNLTASSTSSPAPTWEVYFRFLQALTSHYEPLSFQSMEPGAVSVPLHGSHRRVSALSFDLMNITATLSASVDISHSESNFTSFVKRFIASQEVEMTLEGGSAALFVELSCVLGTLQVSLPINVTAAIPGFNGLPPVQVLSFNIDGSGASANGVSYISTSMDVVLVNPSPASMNLGDEATLGIYIPIDSNGRLVKSGPLSRVGYSVLHNITLYPGNNNLTLQGMLTPSEPALPAVSDLISLYLAGETGYVTVQGESVVMPGNVTAPLWLEAAVQNMSMLAGLPGLPASISSHLMSNTTILAMEMDFGADGTAVQPGFEADIGVILSMPFSIPVDILQIGVQMDFVEDSSGITMASFNVNGQEVEYYPCSSQAQCESVLANVSSHYHATSSVSPRDSQFRSGQRPQTNPLNFDRFSSRNIDLRALDASVLDADYMKHPNFLPNSTLFTPSHSYPEGMGDPTILYYAGVVVMKLRNASLVVEDLGSFQRMIRDLMILPSMELRMTGVAAPRISTPVGVLNVHSVPVNQLLTLPGFNSFNDPPIIVYGGDVTNTTNNSITLEVAFFVPNQTPLSALLGPLSFTVSYNSVPFMDVHFPSYNMMSGGARISTIGTFFMPNPTTDPDAYAVALDALSRYLRSLTSPVTVAGSNTSSPSPYLQLALASLSSGADFPGLATHLLLNGTIYIPEGTLPMAGDKVPSTFGASNPLSVYLNIWNASMTVYLCANQTSAEACSTGPDMWMAYSDPIGYFYDGDLSQNSIYVPPHTNITSERYNTTLQGSLLDEIAMLAYLSAYNVTFAKLNGTMSASMGLPDNGSVPFSTTVFFELINLPMYLGNSSEL